MAKIIFEDEKIQFYQEDKETVFNCSHCGQMGHEIPIRSKEKTRVGKLSTYHAECARGVIYRYQHGENRFQEQKLNVPKPTKTNIPDAPPIKKSYLKSVGDEELERKKNKLAALIKGDRIDSEIEEAVVVKEKVEAKPKARIEIGENGNIFLRHAYDANLVQKYHFIKEIKFNKGFNSWECNISQADYETCRFFFKIHKEVPRFEWLISDEAFKIIEEKIEEHELKLRESKEIKELKSKTDIDLSLDHMKVTPFPYQKVGVAFLNKINGIGMVGDEQGLGKCLIEARILTSEGYILIEDIFQKYAIKNSGQIDSSGGEWFELNHQIKVYSLLEKNLIEQQSIVKIYREFIKAPIKKIKLNNGNEILCTLPHKLLTIDGWKSDLDMNDKIACYDKELYYSKIFSIEFIDYEGFVYDLFLKDNHNYIANGIFSHNTIQAISYTSLHNFRTAIVCPASLKYNWKKEVEKYTDKTAIVLTEFQADELNPKNRLADYVIINYEQLEKYEKYLSKGKFDCVILDESQYIMNLQAKRTKSIFKIFKKTPHRLCLSGTPIKNRPIEFYAQLKFLKPEIFSNKMKYALRYCDAKETPFGWDLKGASNLDELNRKISTFYIRRLKQEVLKELPPKTISVIDVELGTTEKGEYNKIKKDFERFMNEKLKEHGNTYSDQRIDGAHLAKLMELKKFCSHNKVSRVVEFVKNFIDSSENRKIIIFSGFIETQKALRDAFPGISVSLLGEDAAEKRNEAVERFQNDSKIRVFVGSTLAAGVGLTLTAADTVIFADLMWSPADHAQAADRIHRIGQQNPVFIYYMLFKDTIEEMIWAVIGKKLTIINQTLDGKNIQDAQPDVAKIIFKEMLDEFKVKKGKT